MNKLILGICIFFILLAFYVYAKRGFFQENFNETSETRLNISLSDSSNKYESNPLLLLPPPSGGGGNTDKYDMSAQSSSNGTTKGKNPMINVYINPLGKIHFKKSEIEEVFGDQLSKFNKKDKTKWEQEEYGVAKLMVPITWKAMANQYGQLKQLIGDIKTIKDGLNSANVTMVKIEEEAKMLDGK